METVLSTLPSNLSADPLPFAAKRPRPCSLYPRRALTAEARSLHGLGAVVGHAVGEEGVEVGHPEHHQEVLPHTATPAFDR